MTLQLKSVKDVRNDARASVDWVVWDEVNDQIRLQVVGHIRRPLERRFRNPIFYMLFWQYAPAM